MKKQTFILLATLAVTIMISSCGKTDSSATKPADGNYYMKFKANGTQTELTVNPFAQFTLPSTVFTAGLYAYSDAAHKKGITILLNDSAAIKTNKTYNEKLIEIKNLSLYQTGFTYVDKDSVNYFASGAVAGESANVQFSEITSSYVKGTFSGILRDVHSHPPFVFITITDGEFYLKRTF